MTVTNDLCSTITATTQAEYDDLVAAIDESKYASVAYDADAKTIQLCVRSNTLEKDDGVWRRV